MIISDFANDPYGGRVVLLLYGASKIGKTSTILNMVEKQGQLVYILSADKGLLKVRGERAKIYQGKMVISYPEGLRDIRNDMAAMKDRITKLVAKIGREKVWFVIDTTTALQDLLLTESRKIDVSNPSLGKSQKKAMSEDEIYLRDMTTQVDYMVNMGHMHEVVQGALSMPCNIVFTALERKESESQQRQMKRDNRPKIFPRLSGSSYGKVLGDADAILYMRQKEDSTDRILYCSPCPEWEAGDRSGLLDPTEPADLPYIRRKMLGLLQPALPATTPATGEEKKEATQQQ